jgi:hypothetical protein
MPPSFTCLKEGARKGHPLSRPPVAENLPFSLMSGRKKTRLRLKQFLRLFPPTAAMLSVKEWVLEKMLIIAHYHFAELFKNWRKQREDCLRPPQAGEFRSARLFFIK